MDLRSGMFHPNVLTLASPGLTCPCLFVNSINEGEKLLIPIYAMNTDKDVWGRDAFEFKCVTDQHLLLLGTETDSLPHQQTRTLGITPRSRFRTTWRVEPSYDLHNWPPRMHRVPIHALRVRPLSPPPPSRLSFKRKPNLFFTPAG